MGVTICAWYMEFRPHYEPVRTRSEVYELFTIDGRHPAFVSYNPFFTRHKLRILVRAFDSGSGVMYEVEGHGPSLRGTDPDAAIAIARSLLKPNAAP